MKKESLRGKRIIPWFIGAAFVEFLIYYVVSLFVHDFDTYYYYLYFLERFILLAIPVAAAAIMQRREKTRSGALKLAAQISFTRLVAFFPFFYVEYVYGPYDSIEAVLIALLSSLGAVVIYFVLCVAAYALMRYVARRGGGAKYPARMLDLDSAATRSVFAVSLAIFIINLAVEIYSTVLFFIENGTIYYTNEIILMVCSYVFLAVLLLGIHAIGVIAFNRSEKTE